MTAKPRPKTQSRPGPTHRRRHDASGLPPGLDAALDPAAVCAALRVCRRTLTGMVSAGEFPGADFRVGLSPRWRVSTVNRWIAERSGDVAPPAG